VIKFSSFQRTGSAAAKAEPVPLLIQAQQMSEHSQAAEAPRWAHSLVVNWHTVECWVAVAAFTFIAVILLLDVLGRELLGPIVRLMGLTQAT
jgi:hypothetical protein